jgi:hypothetical protein
MILAALVLLSGVGYILDALYYRLLAAAGLSLDVSLSFQPAYMAYGMLQLFVLALALYGLLSLFCCILGRFGLKKTLCGMAFLIGVVIFVSVLRFGTLRWSYGFYLIVNSISRLLTESGQVEFILEMLAIWAVSLICTALLTKTYRKWRLGNTWDCLYLVVVLYLVYVVAIISGFTQYSATVCGVETDTSELIANAVTAEKEVTYEQATMYDYDIWDIPIADTSGMFLSETEAREYGLNVDAWGLTAGTARIVWCFTPSDWFGTARMEVFAKELEASVHYDSSLNYMVMGAMKTTVLQQSCYPLANRFYLGSGENASSIGSLCTITVLEDSDYERWSNDNEAVLEDSDGEE